MATIGSIIIVDIAIIRCVVSRPPTAELLSMTMPIASVQLLKLLR